jgi:hypothetical protein
MPGEGVQEGLELGNGDGLGRLGAEPVLEGLLEPLDFALGLGVAGFPVLLPDALAAQLSLEAVAAALAACESRREDQAIAGQRRGRDAMGSDRSAELCHHGRAADPAVGGDPQRIPGVVIEPAQDLGVRPVREWVVGEVGLPALVRQLGGEPQVGGLRPLGRIRRDQPGPGQVPADRR